LLYLLVEIRFSKERINKMKNIIRTLTAITCLGMAGTALATPVTITFTGDNTIGLGWGICDASMNCLNWGGTDGLVALADQGNLSNWAVANTVTVDLEAGDYTFFWQVSNVASGAQNNPAGLLAEIIWDGNVNVSSDEWYFADAPGSWANAVEYGVNGGTNIWTAVNSGAVSGFANSANWIWTDNNGHAGMDQEGYFSTSISVPEPATLALFGLGLAGFGFARRRKA
jgi:hypothetical protein